MQCYKGKTVCRITEVVGPAWSYLNLTEYRSLRLGGFAVVEFLFFYIFCARGQDGFVTPPVQHGDSPFWCQRSKSVYFVDRTGGTVNRYEAETGEFYSAPVPGAAAAWRRRAGVPRKTLIIIVFFFLSDRRFQRAEFYSAHRQCGEHICRRHRSGDRPLLVGRSFQHADRIHRYHNSGRRDRLCIHRENWFQRYAVGRWVW